MKKKIYVSRKLHNRVTPISIRKGEKKENLLSFIHAYIQHNADLIMHVHFTWCGPIIFRTVFHH